MPITAKGRNDILDLKCRDNNNILFIVEVQNAPQCYLHDHGLYYLCRTDIIAGCIGLPSNPRNPCLKNIEVRNR